MKISYLIFLCLFIVSFSSGVWAEEEPSAKNLELAIRQQQVTIQEIKEQILRQGRELDELKDAHQKNLNEQRALLEELKKQMEEVQTSIKNLREEAQKQVETLHLVDQQNRERLEKTIKDQDSIASRLQREIDRLKEMTLHDFESVVFDGIEYIKIPAGTFLMGTEQKQVDELVELNLWSDLYQCELPARKVMISKPFLISKYEITQKQWTQTMNRNPSAFQGENRPVESVSWNEVQDFIRRLNGNATGTYRLPTEAEWEYCARAGSGNYFGCGKEISDISFTNIERFAWLTGNSENQTHPVGEKIANAAGLHDMLGNVWEWCQDWFHCEAYRTLGDKDPLFADTVTERVFRGGCWGLDSQFARVNFRSGNLPDFNSPFVGFRLVRELQYK